MALLITDECISCGHACQNVPMKRSSKRAAMLKAKATMWETAKASATTSMSSRTIAAPSASDILMNPSAQRSAQWTIAASLIPPTRNDRRVAGEGQDPESGQRN